MIRVTPLLMTILLQLFVSTSSSYSQFVGRGVNVPWGIGNSDIDRLATWRVNVIRWQMFANADNTAQQLRHLNDTIIPRCRLRGIGVIIDMHEPPKGRFPLGHRYEGQHRFMRTDSARVEFVNTWKAISLQYRNEPVVVGYDLCNEPAGTYDQWRPIARTAIEAIRSQNDQKTIIVKTPYGNPDLLRDFVPFRPVHGRIVYSVHFYEPQSFTDPRGTGRTVGSYPNNAQLNIPWLRARLRGVRDFARTHQKHVFIGEFSATVWPNRAKGGDQYLSDLISIFEDDGFSWCYQIYGEADNWKIDAQREQMLRSWFSRN